MAAGQFARSVLADDALKDGFRAGTDTSAFPLAEGDGDRYGGWSSFQAIEPYLNAPSPDVVDAEFSDVELV
jgi:hypothetical protein